MRISDVIPPEHQDWLGKLIDQFSEEVLRLYLVYDEGKFGPDTAREIWDKIAGEDFVAEDDTDIVSNEDIRASAQQGVVHPSPQCGDAGHHWWVEVYLDDKEMWDVVRL